MNSKDTKTMKTIKKTAPQQENKIILERKELQQPILQHIKEGEKAIVIQGVSGSGKTVLISQIKQHLEKKKYTVLLFRGSLTAEMVLKQLTTHAKERGIPEVENLFTARTEFKEKLEKLLRTFLLKEKLLLIFEAFDENLENDGTFKNERIKELLTYLKDTLTEKKAEVVLLLESRYPLPKFPVVSVGLLSWLEFKKLVLKKQWLLRMDNKSLQTLYFEMGGFPRIVEMLEQIAQLEFPTASFSWPLLRERIPLLGERVLHKENDMQDFSYLLLDALWVLVKQELRDIMARLVVFREPIPQEFLLAQGMSITSAMQNELAAFFGVVYQDKNGVFRYEIPRFVRERIRARLPEKELQDAHHHAAAYVVQQNDNETQLEARWHYLQAGEYTTAAQLTFTLDPYYCNIGYPQLAYDLLKDLNGCVENLQDTDAFYFHQRLGILAALFGNWDEALSHLEKALKRNEKLGNRQQDALILGQMARVFEAKGKDEDAVTHVEHALQVFAQCGDTQPEVLVLHLEQAGMLHKRLRHYDEALKRYQQALAIHTTLNNRQGMAQTWEHMGRIFDEQMHFDDALHYYQLSLTEKTTLNNETGMAVLLHQMGNVNFVQGKLDTAKEWYEHALLLNEKLGDTRSAGYSRGQLGLILQRHGKPNEALTFFAKSLLDFEKAQEEKGMAASHHQLGRLYQDQGEPTKALEHYNEAIALREKMGDLLGLAITYGQLGILYYEKKEWETALRFSAQAYAIFSHHGSPNADLSKQNMIRLRTCLPPETFTTILNEYHIQTK